MTNHDTNQDSQTEAPSSPVMNVAQNLGQERTMPRHALEELHEELTAVRRALDLVTAEARHWRRVVEWYADAEQWRILCDDRGRDTFNFRWGDDGGWVARQAIAQWNGNNASS